MDSAESNNNMDSPDWRSTIQPDFRQIIENDIMEALQRHLLSDPDGLVELISEIATNIEEKIFVNGTSQWDYLQKIAMKMVSMETKSQTTGMANTIQSDSATSAQNPPGVQCSAIDWRWRTTLRPDSRQIQVNRILEALKIRYPISASKAVVLLYRMARLSEIDIYSDATSNSDYLHKVYLEVLNLKTRFRTAGCLILDDH